MKAEKGQTTVEYSIMLAMFLTVALVMVVLLSALSDYGWRLLSLVGLDYP
jgi:Flp pilus assembly pilin Flp